MKKYLLLLGEQDDAAAEDGVPLDYDDRLFGSKPDLSYNLDEYRQFLTVRERLLDYDARRIHYINIYGGQYTFGNGIYNGLLSFITRSGRLTNYPTEPNSQYLVYHFPE